MSRIGACGALQMAYEVLRHPHAQAETEGRVSGGMSGLGQYYVDPRDLFVSEVELGRGLSGVVHQARLKLRGNFTHVRPAALAKAVPFTPYLSLHHGGFLCLPASVSLYYLFPTVSYIFTRLYLVHADPHHQITKVLFQEILSSRWQGLFHQASPAQKPLEQCFV